MSSGTYTCSFGSIFLKLLLVYSLSLKPGPSKLYMVFILLNISFENIVKFLLIVTGNSIGSIIIYHLIKIRGEN